MTLSTDFNEILEEARHVFPYETPRPGQLETIAQIVQNFRTGTKHQILDAPTGQGKSIIALCVSLMMESSFYLTSSKVLQSQISAEFGEEGSIRHIIADLKGRNAYPCTYYQKHGASSVKSGRLKQERLELMLASNISCGNDSFCRKQLGRAKCKQCFPPIVNADKWHAEFGPVSTTCDYYTKVENAVGSDHVLMNYHSFLFQTNFTDNFSRGRNLMVLDEAHNAYKIILDFVQVTLSQEIMDHIDKVLPRLTDYVDYAEWAVNEDIGSELAVAAQKAYDERKLDLSEKLSEAANRLSVFVSSATEGHDWVLVLDMSHDGRGVDSVTLKPVQAADFTDRYYFRRSQHFLHMSATILSSRLFAANLGIAPEEFKYIKMGCDFPVKNRPIMLMPTYHAAGGKAKQHEWEPKLIKAVDIVLKTHPEHRGIIHTHNFSISQAILQKTKFRNRMLFQNDFPTKEDMLERHAEIPGSVIVAPAMHEGIDLKDDLSRFQIIVKCPFPNPYEDEQLRKLIDSHEGMWDYVTALKLVQACGRSVRHRDDWAKTYVLDGVACDFITNRGKRFIPNWFREAVKSLKR